ncbi:MAG: serine hydrolase [Actinomycetota bacterium]|jgi:CubicO group peptidase (beta-lactamase class C family)|nr:serine hydrolase [Actinomycetota bacterium]
MDISGFAAVGFGPVADAFAANFVRGGDVGAAVTVYRSGRPVVDLWAGVADQGEGRQWAEDTVVTVFSCSKGVLAVLANLAIERGLLDPDRPVAAYWPEFAAAGKEAVTVRQVLSHQAGLPHVEGTFTVEQVLAWEPVVDALAAEAPQWPPGTRHGYHVRSFGWLVGELLRRVTGLPPDRLLAAWLAGPLGLDFWYGVPEAELARCARLVPPDPTGVDLAEVLGPGSLALEVLTGPSDLFHYDEMWNTTQLRRAVIPSSGGVGDARSLARLYAACVGDVEGAARVLSPGTVAAATEPQVSGKDAILGVHSAWGLGFAVMPFLPGAAGPASFGHGGAGGSAAFADPEAGIGFAYVMNRMRMDTDDRRAEDLVAAVYAALG